MVREKLMDYKDEKTKKYLDKFWELASNEDNIRIQASVNIVEHLSSDIDNKTLRDYSLNRLVKGLCSSRQSARQGFACCLTEVLVLLTNKIDIEALFSGIDDETKITASIKRANERDMIFGRLFGYLCVVRSGILKEEAQNRYSLEAKNEFILKVLVVLIKQLYPTKSWIEEVVCEAVLVLFHSLNVAQRSALLKFQHKSDEDRNLAVLLSKLLSVNSDDKEEEEISFSNANEYMLLLGLQSIFFNDEMNNYVKDKESRQSLLKLFPDGSIIKLTNSMNEKVGSVLLAATTGFPKLHSVWEYYISLLFNTGAAEVHLPYFMTFLTDNFFGPQASHEKKGVGLCVVGVLAGWLTPELVPFVLNHVVLRLLIVSRVNKSHTLFGISGSIIKKIEASVISSPVVCLALATCIVQGSGKSGGGSMANFDAYTGTSLLSSLIHSMLKTKDDENNVARGFLNVLVSSLKNSLIVNDDSKVNEEDQQGDSEKSVACSILDCLYTLAKADLTNEKTVGIAPLVLSILIRVGVFEGIELNKEKKNKVTKFSGQDEVVNAFQLSTILQEVASVMKLVDVKTNPEWASAKAQNLLVNLIADIGHVEYKKSTDEKKQFTYLDFAALIVLKMLSNKQPLSVFAEFEDREVLGEYQEAVEKCCTSVLNASFRGCDKLEENFRAFQTHVLFFALSSPSSAVIKRMRSDPEVTPAYEIYFQTLLELNNSLDTIKAPNDKAENPLISLFNCCGVFFTPVNQGNISEIAEVESKSVKHSSRGVKGAIKKLWHSVSSVYCESNSHKDVLAGVFFEIMRVVVAGDGQDSLDEEDEVDDEDSDENDDDDDDSENDEVKFTAEMAKKFMESKDFDAGDESGDSDNESDDSENSNPGVLQHSEEADGALVKMISLQKEARKSGVMEKKRQEFVLRSRSLDVLEILFHHFGTKANEGNTADLVFPTLLPLLRCIKRNSLSKSFSKLSECKSFVNRIYNILETKLSKKFMNLPPFEGCDALSTELKTCLFSPVADVRSAAVVILLILIKSSVRAKDVESCDSSLVSMVKQILNTFVQKKGNNSHNGSGVNSLIKQLLQKNISFFVNYLLSEINEGCLGKDAFIRSECLEVVGGALKRSGELSHKEVKILNNQILSLIDGLKGFVGALDAESAKSWKKLKPICDFCKELADYCVKQWKLCDSAKSKNRVHAVATRLLELSDNPLLKSNAESSQGIKNFSNYMENFKKKSSSILEFVDENNEEEGEKKKKKHKH